LDGAGSYQFFFINSNYESAATIQFANGAAPDQVTVYASASSFGQNNQVTRLLPGVHYIDNYTLRFAGNGTVAGENMLLYLAGNAELDLTGTSAFRLVGSSRPLYPGMQPGLVVFQARTNTNTLSMRGTHDSLLQGIVYLPDGTLELNGTPQAELMRGQLILSRLSNRSTAGLIVTYQQCVDSELPAVWLSA